MAESYTDFPRDCYTGYILAYIHDWIVYGLSTRLLHRLYTTYMTESYTDLPPDCYTGYILHKYMTESYTDLPRDCYTGYIQHIWLNRTLTFHGTATQVIYYIYDWIVHWPFMGLLHRLYTTYMTELYTDHSTGSAKIITFFFIKRHSLTRIKLTVLYKQLEKKKKTCIHIKKQNLKYRIRL